MVSILWAYAQNTGSVRHLARERDVPDERTRCETRGLRGVGCGMASAKAKRRASRAAANTTTNRARRHDAALAELLVGRRRMTVHEVTIVLGLDPSASSSAIASAALRRAGWFRKSREEGPGGPATRAWYYTFQRNDAEP
jgi:hypothetical protein